MTNATGKQSREYDSEEIMAIARDAAERKLPDWIVGELQSQVYGFRVRFCGEEVTHHAHEHITTHKGIHYEEEVMCLGKVA